MPGFVKAETPVLSAPAPVAAGASAADRSLLLSLGTAVHAGLPGLAETFGEEAKKRFADNPALSRLVRLRLADARLQRSDFEGATKILNEIPGEDAAKNTLLGLAAYGRGDIADAGAQLSRARNGALANADALWRDVLEGFIAAEQGRFDAAEDAFASAKKRAAGDALTSGQLDLLRMRMRLRMRRNEDFGKALDPLSDARQNYQIAKLRAIALGIQGKTEDAIFLLNGVAVSDPDLIAEKHLVIALLLNRNASDGRGGRSEQGRAELLAAVKAEGFPGIQTAALAALRQAVLGALPGETYANANPIFVALTDIANANRESAVIDMIDYVRADIMFEASRRVTSESDRANCLALASNAIRPLEKRASSPLASDALGLAANIAWSIREYRRAADAYFTLANAASGERRAELMLAAADCYFLQGDHAPAAAAYRKARLSGLRVATTRGDAFVDEIRATLADEANANRIADAGRTLAETAGPEPVPPASKLQATWLLADELRRTGERASALTLVTRALGESPDAAMRIRFLWLRGMLELNSGRHREAAATAGLIVGLVEHPAPGTSAEITGNARRILAQTALLRARALLGDSGIAGAINAFRELREKYPDSPSAAGSYLDEGNYLATLPTPKHDAAMEVYLAGYEKFKDIPALSENAANLIYEAAVQALILGDRNSAMLETAAGHFNRLMKEHPRSKLYFRAALNMGNTLRRMNRFDDALKVYRDLVATHSEDRDRIEAELAVADCLLKKGEGANDIESRTNLGKAAAEYDRLLYLPGRTPDLAAEAAYKRAEAVSKAPTPGVSDAVRGARLARVEAAKGLWQAVETLLATPEEAARLGANGRYWAGRSFLLVAELRAANGDHLEARNALNRLISYNRGLKDPARRLDGESVANENLKLYSGQKSSGS